MRFKKCTLLLTGFFLHAVAVFVFVLLSWSIPAGSYAQEGGPDAAKEDPSTPQIVASTPQVPASNPQEVESEGQTAASESEIADLTPGSVISTLQDSGSAPQDAPTTLPEIAAIPRSVVIAPDEKRTVSREPGIVPPIDQAALRKITLMPLARAFLAGRATLAVSDYGPPPIPYAGEVSRSNTEAYSTLQRWSELQRLSLETDRAMVLSTEDAEMEMSWQREPDSRRYAPDPQRFWKWPVQDALALAKGFTSETALIAAGGGAVLFVTARHDAEITAEMSNLNPEPAQLLVKVVEEFGNVRAVRPLAAAVFLGTLMTDDHRLQDAAFTSFEAIILGNLVTSSLKTMFGRARPFQEEGAHEFKPFSGNTSFPSGHATTAFAFVTPWLLYYPSALTPGLVVLSTGTAFTRMLTENHWFTDVVAGSAIGFATAYLLSRRHQDEASRIRLTPSIGPDQVGFNVALKMP